MFFSCANPFTSIVFGWQQELKPPDLLVIYIHSVIFLECVIWMNQPFNPKLKSIPQNRSKKALSYSLKLQLVLEKRWVQMLCKDFWNTEVVKIPHPDYFEEDFLFMWFFFNLFTSSNLLQCSSHDKEYSSWFLWVFLQTFRHQVLKKIFVFTFL